MLRLRNTTRLQSTRRHLLRSVTVLGVALAALTTACSDAPSAPVAPAASQPALAKVGGGPGLTEVAGRTQPLARSVTVRYRIDPARGGSFALPGTGLEVIVPAGAVSSPVEITATAQAGAALTYEFQPHGLRFARPLRMRQDLQALDLKRKDLASLEIAYYGEGSLPDVLGGLGGLLGGVVNVVGTIIPVQEFLGTVINVTGNRVEFDVSHFSGYMASWGRR